MDFFVWVVVALIQNCIDWSPLLLSNRGGLFFFSVILYWAEQQSAVEWGEVGVPEASSLLMLLLLAARGLSPPQTPYPTLYIFPPIELDFRQHEKEIYLGFLEPIKFPVTYWPPDACISW